MKLPKISEKNWLFFIFTFNLFLRLFRIWDPAYSYFDEKPYYLPASRALLAGLPDPNFQHPPLAKELIALMIKIFGDNAFAWRSLQAILASLVVVFVYLLAKRMFGGKAVPLISAFLLTFEFSWFVNSRVAILEMFLASFLFFSFYFAFVFYQEKKFQFFLLSAIFFGFALVSKWTALLFIPLLFFLYFKETFVLKNFLKKLLLFVLITLVLYVTPYLIFLKNFNPNAFLQLQLSMYHFHLYVYPKTNLMFVQTRHEIPYSAWFWPVDNFFTYNLEINNDTNVTKAIILFFHPFILWGALLLVLFRVKDFLIKRKLSFEDFLLIGGFLIFWLPWLFIPRPAYPYYWISGMPFATILLGKFFGQMYKKDKFLVYGFLSTVVLLFLFYYPLLSNWPVKDWYIRLLTGFIG